MRFPGETPAALAGALAVMTAFTDRLPDIQLVLRPGCIDFGWGHPDGALLPAADLQRAATRALGRDGALALAYGAAQGPGRLIELLCERLGRTDGCASDRHAPGGYASNGHAPAPEQILVTAGISHGLDLLCMLCTAPGDIALVESPVYHLALKILRDHRLQLVPIPTDQDGLRVDTLEETLARVRRAGRRVGLLYTVPSFSNPSGRTLSSERRAALVDLALRHDLLVAEDDVYRELWFETPPPSPLASYGAARVVRLGSFSKILAPGLRLGWLVTDPAFVQRCADYGVLDSGGGVSHLTAHIVTEYMREGLLDAHVADLRATYRSRRDALLSALAESLPAGWSVEKPGGGFFAWLQGPEDVDTSTLLARAEGMGVSYVPGAAFHVDAGGHRHLRLAFTLLSPAEMADGARRLGSALRTDG